MSWGPSDPVFVRPAVRIEPLIHRLYAWLLLVAPAAVMNLQRLHVPLWRSYLSAPEVHRQSLLNPRLRGGMFVDIGAEHADELGDMLAALGDHHPTAQFAAAVDELDRMLRDDAEGYDLSPLYERLPAALRGTVELAYDLHNHPRMRFYESLLYRSELFDRGSQGVQVSLGDDRRHRPFMMTSPRFDDPGVVDLPWPLDDPRTDMLMAATARPTAFGTLTELLGAPASDVEALVSSTCELAPDRNHQGPGTRVRYFGHATVVIEHAGECVVVDPFIADAPGAGRFSLADVPDVIDYCLITHGHQDHFEFGTLLRLRNRISRLVVPKTSGSSLEDPSLLHAARALGFKDVIEVDIGDELTLQSGRIVACPFIGEHCDLDIRAKATYAVALGSQTVYLAADNRGLDGALIASIRSMVGDIDLTFLGMECDGAPLTWLYGPLFSDRPSSAMSRGRKLNGCDSDEALRMVRALGCNTVKIYAMGREPWVQYVLATDIDENSHQMKQIERFGQFAAREGIAVENLYGQAQFLLGDGVGS